LSHHHEVWLDKARLRARDRWRDVIFRELLEGTPQSPDAVNSQWVLKESRHPRLVR
jgi:hypothetical protein